MKEKKYIQKKNINNNNNFSINNFNFNNNNNNNINIFNSSNSIKNTGNNTSNNNSHKRTSSLINNYTKQKRWERLYQLDKVQREKLKRSREIQDNYRNQHELDECTFSPQIYNKFFSNNNNYNSMNINNIDKNDPENFLIRQKVWNRKRNEKMESMKKENENKYYDECIFSPKISTYDIPYYEGTTADIVLDPESYEAYINKKNKIRNKKKEEKILEDTKPGSGNIWKNKNIINFYNEDKKKSNTSNNSDRNLRKIKEDMLFISNANGELEGIDYDSAKKWLHNELFSIEI